MTALRPVQQHKATPAAFSLLDSSLTDQTARELRAAGYAIKSPSFHNGRAVYAVIKRG
ncbi:hypothetical protein [Aquitalea magnusonii]|jgi:hypothetical protein|uniref:Uncharacterized protein n=1 Tax=Aquitalea magnusonii TaxID=332411 RepID=A0A318K605_9NEIS|nr:hypothetical protein [Aquitalea magnusonii]PXX49396.1 hypothetical protein DFR38_10436 [Aquitalea magnusonii]